MANATYSKADYVEQWGHATSLGVFDAECQLFTTPGIDGAIGHRWQSKNAIVIGDPMCPKEQWLPLITAFKEHCAQAKRGIIYIATSHEFMQWAQHHALFASSIEIGNECILNPAHNVLESTGRYASRLRTKHKGAVRDGLTVQEYRTHDPLVEQRIEDVAAAWLHNRKGPQIYLSKISVLADKNYKRYIYAEQHGNIIGILILNRINRYQGWFINLVALTPQAHVSTSEFLMLKALEILRAEGCNHLSVGVNNANSIRSTTGFHPSVAWSARKVFRIICKLFHLDNRERYWNKFEPVKVPAFVLFPRTRVGLRDLLDMLYALNIKKK